MYLSDNQIVNDDHDSSFQNQNTKPNWEPLKDFTQQLSMASMGAFHSLQPRKKGSCHKFINGFTCIIYIIPVQLGLFSDLQIAKYFTVPLQPPTVWL